MSYDCIVFKAENEPFIQEVKSETADFEIVYPARKVYESFSLYKVEEPDEESGKSAVYLVANRSGVSREEIREAILRLRPRYVRLID